MQTNRVFPMVQLPLVRMKTLFTIIIITGLTFLDHGSEEELEELGPEHREGGPRVVARAGAVDDPSVIYLS